MIDIQLNKSIGLEFRAVLLTSPEQINQMELGNEAQDFLQEKLNAGATEIVLKNVHKTSFYVRVEQNSWTKEGWRNAGAKYCQLINEDHSAEAAIHASGVAAEYALAFLEGVLLSNYQFLKYKTNAKLVHSLKSVSIEHDQLTEKQIQELVHLSEAVYAARDLVNEPVIHMTAPQLAKEIQSLSKVSGFEVEVMEKEQIESLGMGGLLAVNYGSVDPPRFSILKWQPQDATNDKPIILVGKGVVYDTGGLSLKPTKNSMDSMKSDMGGAAAVVGAMTAIAKNKLPVNVMALVPSTDNRPGKNAYAPGDVIKMYNGLNVEVLNTDAEGRMILADALSYGDQFDPALVITVATLTGAAVVALGEKAIVGMGNAGDNWKEKIKSSGEEVHERVVEFPFWDEYAEMLETEVADLKNIGGPYAGSITAGKFLEHFTKKPYFHLDIAGPAFLGSKDTYRPVGGSGVGVRLLYDFVKKAHN